MAALERRSQSSARGTCYDPPVHCSNHQAIAGMKRSEWRRILVRLRQAPTPAESDVAGVGATNKAGEKTSQAVCFMTEIAEGPRAARSRARKRGLPAGQDSDSHSR